MTKTKDVKQLDANEVAKRAWALRTNMMRVALSILRHTADAEDAVSSAMLSAQAGADSLRDPDKLNAWLMRILVRCCYDTLRKRKRETPTQDMSLYDAPAFTDTQGSVWESIKELSPSYQRTMVLYYYEGFNAREIAHILSEPLGTVLVRLSRGRAKLKDILLAEGVMHCDKQGV